jgi:hypothetical protein
MQNFQEFTSLVDFNTEHKCGCGISDDGSSGGCKEESYKEYNEEPSEEEPCSEIRWNDINLWNESSDSGDDSIDFAKVVKELRIDGNAEFYNHLHPDAQTQDLLETQTDPSSQLYTINKRHFDEIILNNGVTMVDRMCILMEVFGENTNAESNIEITKEDLKNKICIGCADSDQLPEATINTICDLVITYTL